MFSYAKKSTECNSCDNTTILLFSKTCKLLKYFKRLRVQRNFLTIISSSKITCRYTVSEFPLRIQNFFPLLCVKRIPGMRKYLMHLPNARAQGLCKGGYLVPSLLFRKTLYTACNIFCYERSFGPLRRSRIPFISIPWLNFGLERMNRCRN